MMQLSTLDPSSDKAGISACVFDCTEKAVFRRSLLGRESLRCVLLSHLMKTNYRCSSPLAFQTSSSIRSESYRVLTTAFIFDLCKALKLCLV